MANTGITTKAVARRLNLSVERVRQLANAGQLPCTKTELGRLFDPDEVEAFAQARVRYARTSSSVSQPS
jgi:excisionase family DNA binding protein